MAPKKDVLQTATADVPEGTAMVASGEALASAIGWVGKAASKDETRRALTGIRIEAQVDHLLLVSTDSYRLHVATVPAAALWRAEGVDGALVQAHTTKGYAARPGIVPGVKGIKGEATVEIFDTSTTHERSWCETRDCNHREDDHPKRGRCTSVSHNVACKCKAYNPSSWVTSRGSVLVTSAGKSCRLPILEADFPNWRQLLPGETPVTATFDAPSLLGVALTLRDAAKEQYRAANAEYKKAGYGKRGRPEPQKAWLILEVAGPLVRLALNGRAITGARAKTTGKISVGLNPAYLCDALAGFAGEVTLGATTNLKPVMLSSEGRQALLMPVRIT